jgi:hypothetical protein
MQSGLVVTKPKVSLQNLTVFDFYLSYENVKQSHNTPMGAQGGRRNSSYSFTTATLDGGECQRHGPAALYPWGKDPRYQLYRSLIFRINP